MSPGAAPTARDRGAALTAHARRALIQVALSLVLSACHSGSPGQGSGARGPGAGPTHTSRQVPSSEPTPMPPPRGGSGASRVGLVDQAAHSTSDPSSIWVIVNKRHPLPPAFRPHLLIVRGYLVARPAARPLEGLLQAASAEAIGFKIASAYRSYAYQARVHADIVAAQGPAAADRVSARAGHSEHQTGLAIDLVTPAHPRCDFERCFRTTPAGRWLAKNAWRFGFIVRYTGQNEATTGYAPEPWHIRFVGRPLAARMHRTSVSTLEGLFGVSGGDYLR